MAQRNKVSKLKKLYAASPCCVYCDKTTYLNVVPNRHDRATVDHIIPLSRGGTNAIENLAVACLECNGLKSNMTAEEFRFLALQQRKIIKLRAMGMFAKINSQLVLAGLELDIRRIK